MQRVSARWKKRTLTAILTFAGVAGLAVLAGLFFVWWSLPTVSGKLNLAGLKHEVRVVRDEWGIPHIYAQDELDAFRALGFVAAQDRLFQMDIHRRLANGQLSEIVGEAALPVDEIARTLGFRHYADELLASGSLGPEALRAAEAYRDGLNAYVATQKLPVEFALLNYQPRKFEIAEMLAFAGYMSYGFSEAFRGDILFSDLLRDIPAEKINELRTGVDESAPTIAKAVPVDIDRQLFARLHDASLWQTFGSFDGSNSWVLAPSRSKSGHAILANDPHIGFSKPSVWYEAHLVSPTLEVYGHFMSFIPFPILGRTRDMAWAITMSEIDDMDFYREKQSDVDSKQVWFKGHWVNLAERAETILVKGRPDVRLTVETGPHGPLVQNLIGSGKADLISVKWQYHEPQNRALESFFLLAHAKTIENFKDALRIAKTPGLNISYVDRSGNIAWWVMGQIPNRPGGSQPDMVLDGASGADEYLGYVPFEKNPHLVNPPGGLIITANNKSAVDTAYPLHGYFQPSERAVQLQRLLGAQEQWSADELMRVQTNQDEVFGLEQVSTLIAHNDAALTGIEKQAYDAVKNWRGQSDVSSVGAAIYNEWRSQILRGALLDEMGEERFKLFCETANTWHFYKRLIANPKSDWWDDVKSAEHVESENEIVTRAFRQAVAILRARFGGDIHEWTWGKLHTVEYSHPLGRVKPLNLIFNAGPYPAGGNYSQVDAMAPARGEETFAVVYGPSTRRIIDFGNIEKSWGINPLGNSGNLWSPHERDQVQLFLSGQYRFELMGETEVQKSAKTTLRLSSK